MKTMTSHICLTKRDWRSADVCANGMPLAQPQQSILFAGYESGTNAPPGIPI
jgi:hypothetical protein